MLSNNSVRNYFCFVLICTCAQVLNAQYYAGEVGSKCTTNSGISGICTLFENCESDLLYAEGIKLGLQPKICGLMNREFVICCPQTETKLSISEQKCEEYRRIKCPPMEGRPVHLIYGGERVENVQDFPHQVHLGYGNINNPSYWCGGSLISERWVLTAAHCLGSRLGSPIVADMGFLNTENRNEFGTHQRIRIIQEVKHPNRRLSRYDDIALLKLERPVRMSPNVVPACLHNTTSIPVQYAQATGWGSNEKGVQSVDLMEVSLKIADDNTCVETYRLKFDRKLTQGIKPESQFCAGEPSKDTCPGDSGGPLQITHSNYCTYSIIGITSFGSKISCGSSKKPAVYTRVSHYIPWIESVVWPNYYNI